jgi:hypothetical protein
MLTSIEKRRGEIKRFEENSTKFSTFKPQSGLGEAEAWPNQRGRTPYARTAEAGGLIPIEHGPFRGANWARRRWLSAEGDMLTSIEKTRGEIKRFEEINAEFNTFKPPSGPGEIVNGFGTGISRR